MDAEERCQQPPSVFLGHEARPGDSDSITIRVCSTIWFSETMERDYHFHPDLDRDLMAHKAWQDCMATGINPFHFQVAYHHPLWCCTRAFAIEKESMIQLEN